MSAKNHEDIQKSLKFQLKNQLIPVDSIGIPILYLHYLEEEGVKIDSLLLERLLRFLYANMRSLNLNQTMVACRWLPVLSEKKRKRYLEKLEEVVCELPIGRNKDAVSIESVIALMGLFFGY